jgi:hypothetical protein
MIKLTGTIAQWWNRSIACFALLEIRSANEQFNLIVSLASLLKLGYYWKNYL